MKVGDSGLSEILPIRSIMDISGINLIRDAKNPETKINFISNLTFILIPYPPGGKST
jgi:hypothetical protein